MEEAERPPGKIALLVPDSGRTWGVLYHQLQLIPPGTIQRGDVFIVRHAQEEGVMLMQAVAPTNNGHNGWMLKALQLRKDPD